MNVLSPESKNPYQITGQVELTTDDTPFYCGHYTIDGLRHLLADLTKQYKDDELVVVQAVYRAELKSYMLVVIPDARLEEGKGTGLQGCQHGTDGTYEPLKENIKNAHAL
jgi:hypothetical protein